MQQDESIYTPLQGNDDEHPFGQKISKIAVVRPEDIESKQPGLPKPTKLPTVESMNFEEPESAVWRRHHLHRYSLNKARTFTTSQITTSWID